MVIVFPNNSPFERAVVLCRFGTTTNSYGKKIKKMHHLFLENGRDSSIQKEYWLYTIKASF